MADLKDLQFDNRFFNELPADPVTTNSRRQVSGACYSKVAPTPARAPQQVAYSKEVAALIGLDPHNCESGLFSHIFAGNQLLEGMQPYAQCYGGHQFGNWAGQLGDGRAINLGEVVNAEGEHWTLQLKGAGPTPYSRSADGLAVLRSSVREFLCSEAMFHLGVPTTRALSLTLTGEQVVRDMFYDGRAKPEPGAVVCRVAPSFTRFGSFQLPASRGDNRLLKELVDFTIRTDFPHLGEPNKARYLAWFKEVCQKTAEMVIHWQRVGFVHGVMNTDNMSILGLTIDYGPYGWLEDFDPDWTPNTTDSGNRRYRYAHQPQIAQWNLGQLANAIFPLIEEAEPLQEALTFYADSFDEGWHKMMMDKLGLSPIQPESDRKLVSDLLDLLSLVETDMTIFFRKLAHIDLAHNQTDETLTAPLAEAYYQADKVPTEVKKTTAEWLRRYIERATTDTMDRNEQRKKMDATNPKYVLRNYMAQLAIDKAEQEDFSVVIELLELLRKPYDEQPTQVRWAEKRPEWARDRAGCSMLSCSS
jgi:uncharacterized protein YdiU (UPF0061 family)